MSVGNKLKHGLKLLLFLPWIFLVALLWLCCGSKMIFFKLSLALASVTMLGHKMCRLLHCRLHLCRIAVSTIRAYTVPHCCTMYILIVALVLSHDIQIVACPALMKTMTHILSLLAVTLQNPIQIPVWVSYWKDNKRARNGNVSHRISNNKNKN